MNKNLFSLLIALVIIFQSCNKVDQSFSLESDQNLSEFYSEDEIKELNKIVAFTDSFIMKKTNEMDMNKAYHQFFDSLAPEINGDKYYTSPIPENEKYAFLVSLDKNVFNSIWWFDDEASQINYRDTILTDFTGIKYLTCQPFEAYAKYIEKTGETDSIFFDYSFQLERAGGMSAGFPAAFTKHHEQFDFNIPKNRLFAAMFILSLEDPIYVKLDKYFGKS